MVITRSKGQILGLHFGKKSYYPVVNYHNYGQSPFSMGKSTISMAIFNSYVKLPEGIKYYHMMRFLESKMCQTSRALAEAEERLKGRPFFRQCHGHGRGYVNLYNWVWHLMSVS